MDNYDCIVNHNYPLLFYDRGMLTKKNIFYLCIIFPRFLSKVAFKAKNIYICIKEQIN